MITKLKQYFKGFGRRYQKIKEARAILKVLGQPSAAGSDPEVLETVMNIGLGHLRAMKSSQDIAAAAREMDLWIKQGPRPGYQEAKLN